MVVNCSEIPGMAVAPKRRYVSTLATGTSPALPVAPIDNHNHLAQVVLYMFTYIHTGSLFFPRGFFGLPIYGFIHG
jgi:hypothetical protein